MTGKTARGNKMIDEWLMLHPYRKALIIDSKTGEHSTRQFIPNLQLRGGNCYCCSGNEDDCSCSGAACSTCGKCCNC